MADAQAVTEGGLLGGQIRYRQFASGHRSGFEPVLLAASVPAMRGEHVLEGGTGAGAALLCLAHRVPGVAGVGLEIVKNLASLADENFTINGLGAYSCVCGDVEQHCLGGLFDHAMANPPWHDSGGTRSPDAKRALAHHAGIGLLARWIAGLTASLQPHGSLTLILPAAQYGEAAALLRQQDYGALQLFPLWPRAGLPARLVLMAARRGARGADKLWPGLVLHDATGITEAAQLILRDGGATALAAVRAR